MTKRASAKILRDLQSSVADMVTAAPETAAALTVLLNHYTKSGAGVTVKGSKTSGSKTPRRGRKAAPVEDDLDDGFDDDLEDDLEDFDDDLDGDDEEDEKPARRTRRTSKKPAAKKTTRRTRKPAPVEEDDFDDEEDEVEAVELELSELTPDEVWGLLEGDASEVGISDTYAKMKITALKSELKGLGFEDVSELEGEGTRGERVENLRSYLSAIEAVTSAIANFDNDDIEAAYEDLTDEGFPKVRGRGDARTVAMAKVYFEAVLSMEEEDE